MLEINEETMKAKSDELVSNLAYFEKYGRPIVDEYSRDLDEKVTAIKSYLDSVRQYDLDFDVPSIQRMLIDLSTTIYFTNDNLEKLGLLDDMSKIKYKDKYNDVYLAKQGASRQEDRKYTADQLRALAEAAALEENLLNFIYSHAASILESKLDSANELLKALSKILSSKIQEMSTFGVSNKFQ